ncbi:MAG: oxidoreductase [Ruminococcaceae bacterium]|nr:oxidoreductase [Oscillospiraceae bacterium]
MKAYVLVNPMDMQVQERAVPDVSDDDVLVRVTNVGLCGSDIHLYKGTYNGPHNYPMLFGHEWSGIVEKTGKGVTGLKPGDKVTGDCSRYCGECDACRRDKNLCTHIEKFGITVDGASAEYIVRNQKYLYKADTKADLALLALTEPISVAKHLLEKVLHAAGSLRGKKILVYGGGAIGQAALLLLKRLYGCEEVDLSDLIAFRTDLAKSFGANIPSQEELKVQGGSDYASLYSQARYDVIIETTGVAPVFANALNLLKPGGVLGCVGMIASVEIAQKLIVTKALTVLGSIGGTGEFEQVIRFIHENETEAARLISHHFKMENASQAFETAVDANQAMKITLEL